MKIESCVALVTGGASGIGRGVAATIVGRGGRVVILDLPGSAGAEVAMELGSDARFVACDVTAADQVVSAVAAAHEAFGQIDALISCAGIIRGERVMDRRGALHSLDGFRRHLEVNTIGVFDVLRHAVACMAQNPPSTDGERGVVVNVASIAAYEGQAGQAAYAASKGAIVSMTLPLARELGPLGIRAVCLCPGVIDTPMLDGMPPGTRESLSVGNLFPARLGTPSDVGEMVLAVLENVFLNGEVIRLDAGARLAAR